MFPKAKEETYIQIKHDEKIAMELQRHLLEENAIGAELTDVSTEIAFEDDQSDGMRENKTETNRTKGFTSLTNGKRELTRTVSFLSLSGDKHH